MLARMKEDLLDRYKIAMPGEFEATDSDSKKELVEFLGRIEGEIVELVFIEDDAFEKEDNNFWLHDDLWDKI